ncbi:MAG: PTS sugar transporter subunit IIA [Betaproteobacteria bacterium RBG_19FT_COMBO_58_11]|nr:MAG: PTS sugar transporter subunit IIA [Betaproteobacteria bacterium RBG_19FT_COMBO_58_11]
MSLITSLLKPEYVLLDLDAGSKDALFEEIARHIAPALQLDPKLIEKSLVIREKLGSTGLGQGVAIPHGRIKQLKEAAGVFIRTRDAVPFGAPDNEPVRLLFVLLVPEHATDLHLQILSELAQLFGDRALRERLLHTSNADEAYQLLT